MAVCQEFEIESEIIPRIAGCFGGGLEGIYVPYWVEASFIEELRPEE